MLLVDFSLHWLFDCMCGHMSGLLQNHYGTGSAEELRLVIATVEPRHPASVGLTVNEREAGPSHFDYTYIYSYLFFIYYCICSCTHPYNIYIYIFIFFYIYMIMCVYCSILLSLYNLPLLVLYFNIFSDFIQIWHGMALCSRLNKCYFFRYIRIAIHHMFALLPAVERDGYGEREREGWIY